MNVDKL